MTSPSNQPNCEVTPGSRPFRRGKHHDTERPASELVGRDDLAAGPGREEAEGLRVHSLLDEPNRPVAEEEVAPARVKAPIIVCPGSFVIGDVDPALVG